MLEKTKGYLKKHEDKIKEDASRLVWYGLGFGVAWTTGRKLQEAQINQGLLTIAATGKPVEVSCKNGGKLLLDVTKVAEK